MEIIDYLLARKKAGGGSDVTIEQLSVTENGTYSEDGIAYSPVVVNVPAPANSYQLKDVPSGTVSTIDDGTALPMPSLKVGIEPVQDLHGYDHPWVGGAGKNLFDIDAEYTIVNETYAYELYVKPNTAYTLSSNCPFSSPANLYFNGGSTETNGVGLDYPKTFNSDKDGKLIIYVRHKANEVSIDLYTAVKNGQYYIQLEQGSTATSYEPYSNICPISGWTEANVTRCGKNLFNIDNVKNLKVTDISGLMRYGVIIEGSGEFSISVNCESFTNNDYLYVRTYNPDGSIINTYHIISGTTVTPANFSLTQGQYLILFDAVESSLALSKERMERWKPQIELGTEVTTYEPYNGQTYTIQFTDGDNPLTVYGGTLDVTSGELVVDRAEVDLGTFNWTASNHRFNTIIPLTNAISRQLGMCSAYKSDYGASGRTVDKSICVTNGNGFVYIYDTSKEDDVVSFKTAMNGVQLVYELAEPITYHLTPTQVRTLVSNNNIWADTGDIIEGSYFKSLT